MAGCWADLERPAAARDNLPRRGESPWTRKKEFTWPTREIAASWSCKCHETIHAHHHFSAGRNLHLVPARRDVSPVADAIVHAGGVPAGVRRAHRACNARPLAWQWPEVSDYFDWRYCRPGCCAGLRLFSPAVCFFQKLGTCGHHPAVAAVQGVSDVWSDDSR